MMKKVATMEAEVRIDTDMARVVTDTDIQHEPNESPSQVPVPNTESTSHTTRASEQQLLYTSISSYPFTSDSEYQLGLATILGHPETPATPLEVASNQDLVTQAQCFYFSRKFNTPPINPADYQVWLLSSSSSRNGRTAQTPTIPTTSAAITSLDQAKPAATVGATTSEIPQSQPQLEASTNPTGEKQQESAIPTTTSEIQDNQPPPYPTSFAAIVDLITSNKPVPGIQEIPDTVLDLGSSKRDQATRRRKPWEKTEDEDGNVMEPSTTSTTTKIVKETREEEEKDDTIKKAKMTGQGVVKILQPNAIPDSGLIAKEE